MQKRKMKQRINGIIGCYVISILSHTSFGKTLKEELDQEFEIICKFKKPTYSMRKRWELAILECAEVMINKDPYFQK